MAVAMSCPISSILRVCLLTAVSSKASLFSSERVCALTAPSMASSFSACVLAVLSMMSYRACSFLASSSLELSMAVAMRLPISSSLMVWLLTAVSSNWSLPWSMRVCACMAASMVASLVSRVAFTEVSTSMMACSLVCWSAFILSMASVSFRMACSFLSEPLLMASTTLAKSLMTDTFIV